MKCESCGKEFEAVPGQDKCPHCGVSFSIPQSGGEEGLRPPSTKGPEISKPLWEDKGPFFSRLFNTWVRVMFHPTQFFKAMPVTSEIGRPLIYALVVGTIGWLCGIFWQFAMQAIQIPLMAKIPTSGEVSSGAGITAIFTVAMIPVFLVLAPIGVVIGQFIWSGILHLCLIILGGNKKGFGATFRVVAYGGLSPGVFQIICCGGFVALVWGIVLQIIGLKETHQISTGKAVLAFFLPLIFCCGCGIMFIVLGIGAAATSGS